MWDDKYDDSDNRTRNLAIALAVVAVLGVCFLVWSFFSIQGKKEILLDLEQRSAGLQAQLDESVRLEGYDEQTGVLNVEGLKKYLTETLPTLGDKQVALYYVSFASPAKGRSLKSINDEFGHFAGRDAGITFAEYLKSTFPKERFVCARLGGSSFMVFDTAFQSREDTLKYIKKMKALWHDTPYKVDELHQIEGMSLHTTAYPFVASTNAAPDDLIDKTGAINKSIRDLAYFTFMMQGDTEPLLQD